jgi:hypothetical protein
MQTLLSRLCISCSDTHKWLLVYFSLALDCSVCILDGLFYTSLAYLRLRKNLKYRSFSVLIWNTLRNLFVQRLGCGAQTMNCYTWENSRRQLDLNLHDTGFSVMSCDSRIQLPPGDNRFVQFSFYINLRRLYIISGFLNPPRHEIRPWEFEWIINTCIEETLKHYAQ